MILNYLHDIRNKITIVNTHTALLSQKYRDEELNIIKVNILRINDLINETYKEYKRLPTLEQNEFYGEDISLNDFVNKLDLIIDSLALGLPLEINNLLPKSKINSLSTLRFSIHALMQVLENALDNSLKANSSKLTVQIKEIEKNLVLELIDNGSGISPLVKTLKDSSAIPQGLGKKFMLESMRKMNGNVEWIPRMDGSGMIVRLYFFYEYKSDTLESCV